ncbi:ankyrin repeat domain-containing protein, partial [Verrucomicrobia bacterium]|nr:ankyrin repeat domain-containing protein [Verrucomicrobiota bacterium]
MKIPCSNCNQRLEIPEELAGQTIECPACNATLAVPALETPPPAVPQVQESAPQAASSKKSKSSIPKWAIASFAGIAVVVVGLIMFFPDKAVETDEESQRPSPPAESKRIEPVAEAAKPEPPTAKAPDISIHDAAYKGNIEAVKQHLAAGTDVNAKDEDGWTSLNRAALKGHKEIVELLIAEGADVNAKDKDGWTLLHLTAYNGHKDIVELLITNGADVNAKTKGGVTPLSNAAYFGHKEVAELLIAEGADVNAKDIEGKTALYTAMLHELTEFVAFLRKHGGKSGANDSILIAASVGNIEAVKQHLASGSDVNV